MQTLLITIGIVLLLIAIYVGVFMLQIKVSSQYSYIFGYAVAGGFIFLSSVLLMVLYFWPKAENQAYVYMVAEQTFYSIALQMATLISIVFWPVPLLIVIHHLIWLRRKNTSPGKEVS